MARRARTIKPEILEDSKTATLSHLEYRIFVGTWLVADDHGNLRGEPELLRGQLVWATAETGASVARAINTLVERGLLVSYTVRGQSYLHIAGWAKHQRIDRPSRPTTPGPDQADPKTERDLTSFVHVQSVPESDLTSSSLVRSLQVPGLILASLSTQSRERLALEGEGEGEGDQDLDPPHTPLTGGSCKSNSIIPSKPARKRNRSRVDATAAELASVRVILDRLGTAAAVAYRGCDAHVRLIVGRLRDGITEAELRAVVAYCAEEWDSKPEMRRYLRPETLFGPSTVNRYLDAARTRFATELAALERKQREGSA